MSVIINPKGQGLMALGRKKVGTMDISSEEKYFLQTKEIGIL